MQMEWSSPSRLAVEALRAEADIEIVEGAGHYFDWCPEGIEESAKRSCAYVRKYVQVIFDS